MSNVASLGAVAATSLLLIRRRRRRLAAEKLRRLTARRFWVRCWLLRRPEYGLFEKLVHELARDDKAGFRNFLRVEPDLFRLGQGFGPWIEKQLTFMRKPLGPGLKLAITLRYLATGHSCKTLEYGFRVANNTISLLVPETCEAIFDELGGEYMQCPSTPDEWKLIAEGFSKRWNFHNCLGALDGKHVAPSGAGSVFSNYKGFHSVVLMAIVESDYRFIYVDVGANGR